MTGSQVLVATLSAVLMAAAAAGLVARRRARLCRSFLAYLLVVILTSQLSVWFPEAFHTQWFWTLRTAVYDVLRALIAVEIALLTFSEMPRARRRAELTLGLVLALALALTLLPEGRVGDPYLAVLGVVAPRGTVTSLWLFVAVLAVAYWHRAPVHPFHRSLLLAFTLYLGTATWLLRFVGLAAASRPAYLAAYAYLAAIEPLAFAVTAGFWTWSAWRPEPRTALSPAVARRLQPWAAACSR
jgi:hypothetical protein